MALIAKECPQVCGARNMSLAFIVADKGFYLPQIWIYALVLLLLTYHWIIPVPAFGKQNTDKFVRKLDASVPGSRHLYRQCRVWHLNSKT